MEVCELLSDHVQVGSATLVFMEQVDKLYM